jgi:hypothetical protein
MDDKIYDLLEKVYLEVKQNSNDIKTIQNQVNKTNIILENDVKPKIQVLFEGYETHTRLLEDIRDEVARHEEVIIKRVK